MGNQKSKDSLLDVSGSDFLSADNTNTKKSSEPNVSSINKSQGLDTPKMKSTPSNSSSRSPRSKKSKEKERDQASPGEKSSRRNSKDGTNTDAKTSNSKKEGDKETARKKKKKHDEKSEDKTEKRKARLNKSKGTPPTPGVPTPVASQRSLGKKHSEATPNNQEEDNDHMYAISRENEYDYALVGFKEGKLYFAMYDYEAQTEYNISFKRGDRVLVLDQTKPDWWNAVIGPKRGFVPANYLCENTLTLGPWYFKNCTRANSERLLMTANPGQFLIRNRDKVAKDSSNSVRSEYSLSVKVTDVKTQHYKIGVILNLSSRESQESIDIRYYIDKRKRFKSLAKLVKHYSKNLELDVLLTEPCTLEQPTTTGLCIPGLQDKWEIPKEEITFQVILGSGQFGEVWHGRWNNILDVAVKVLKSESTMKKDEFLMEARVMKQLHHRHLVQLYAVCSESEPMYIITELAANGSLKDFLIKDTGKMTTPFLTGLAETADMELVHEAEADNTNVKTRSSDNRRNVVVSQDTVCKICDFGLARWLTEDTFYQARRGSKFPVRWTAPEAMVKGKFTIKSDVWSFGVLLYEIITRGLTPYKGMSNKEVMEFVLKDNKLSKPKDCPDWYFLLMTKCWRRAPDQRPTFKHIQKFIHKNSADEIANSLDMSDPGGEKSLEEKVTDAVKKVANTLKNS